MAEEHRLTGVDFTTPPWPLLLEVAEATPPNSWVLMGGMMVHLHALRGRVTAVRPTTDVDVLLNLEAATVATSPWSPALFNGSACGRLSPAARSTDSHGVTTS